MLYEISVLWRDADGEDRESARIVEAPAFRVRSGQVYLPPAMVRWGEETIGTDADGDAGRHVYGIDIARYFPARFTRESTQYPAECGMRSTLTEYRYPDGLHAHLARRARALAGLAADAAAHTAVIASVVGP